MDITQVFKASVMAVKLQNKEIANIQGSTISDKDRIKTKQIPPRPRRKLYLAILKKYF